ncbi:hypothetical protein GIB67_031180 [Kingdonia uniflora]|uniref:Uncharacterized protein n=1 Tax=Kingdonia uniflora TaxID=39325 RepID=A0A7J7NK85_9MAGN|nr:hypothetical protein GIB67_031180 [Kingdonia uniflora]
MLSPTGIRTKLLCSSGFTQFFVKNSLNGKGVVSNCPEARNGFSAANMNPNKEKSAQITRVVDASTASPNLGVKADVTLPQTVVETDPNPRNSFQGGISLIEWLKPGSHIVIKLKSFINLGRFWSACHSNARSSPPDSSSKFSIGISWRGRFMSLAPSSNTLIMANNKKQASKLVDEVGCLQADLEDVGKRHMLITQASSSKKPLRLEAFPRATSLSNMIEARLIINIDQLENTYFTMKSQELSSKSKPSCICWNNYIKNYLTSTDYDGVVQIWDASTGQGFSQYAKHQKRAWSVDFSQLDPTKLASGSDDHSVKLWTINERKSVNTIRNVANVCCVQFSPHSANLLAFGSADYKTYCHDLRNIKNPWCTFSSHEKAVSYI